MSKWATCTAQDQITALRSADDTASGLPLPGVFFDGRPCEWGSTDHIYDVRKHPTDDVWAYPVPDETADAITTQMSTRATPIKGEKQPPAIEIVDALDETWDEVAAPVEAVEAEPAQVATLKG